MKRFIALLLLVASLGAVVAAEKKPAAPEKLIWKAGVATVVLTPQSDIWMAGYASRKEPSEGTEQDLFAKALAIQDQDGNRVLFITLDLMGRQSGSLNRVLPIITVACKAT